MGSFYWSTHKRVELIRPEIEQMFINYIRATPKQKCLVSIVNGMPEHIHCLFMLNKQKSISDVIKQVKGSSSHYINKNNLIPEKFSWQTGYASFSISESAIDKVYQYIKNHSRKSFQEEYNEFLRVYGFDNERNEITNTKNKLLKPFSDIRVFILTHKPTTKVWFFSFNLMSILQTILNFMLIDLLGERFPQYYKPFYVFQI